MSDGRSLESRSCTRLLELPFSVLCFNHGAPLTDDPHAALRAVLKRDAGETGGRRV